MLAFTSGAVVGLALLGFVHFVPTEDFEAPVRDIFIVYETPLAGTVALGVLAGLIASVTMAGLAALGAIRARSRPTGSRRGRTVLPAPTSSS